MKKRTLVLLTLLLLGPALLGASCSTTVRDSALAGLGAYVAATVKSLLETFLPF
jgi:hypothetical protein